MMTHEMGTLTLVMARLSLMEAHRNRGETTTTRRSTGDPTASSVTNKSKRSDLFDENSAGRSSKEECAAGDDIAQESGGDGTTCRNASDRSDGKVPSSSSSRARSRTAWATTTISSLRLHSAAAANRFRTDRRW